MADTLVPYTGTATEAETNGHPVSPTRSVPLLRRPRGTEGFWGWVTTIDHKRIGVLYGTTAFAFFLIGGFEALLIRMQLAQPHGTVLSADAYNQVFTMHGTTMVFLVGGFEALLIRMQLAQPHGHVLSADAYNQVFTMHGTTMVGGSFRPRHGRA